MSAEKSSFEEKPKPLKEQIIQQDIKYRREKLAEEQKQFDLLTAIRNARALENEFKNTPANWIILPDWKTATQFDDWSILIGDNPNASAYSKSITDNLANRFPRHKDFINSIMRPDIKISSVVWREIFEKLEAVLTSIDINTQKTTVHNSREYWDVNEKLDFSDKNSKNPDVAEFRRVVNELNDKYFTWKKSPFHLALLN